MFAGRFDHALDDKGRTMMPKRFRDRLSVTEDRTVWMARSLDGTKHLEVRPAPRFKAYFESVSSAPQTATPPFLGAAGRPPLERVERDIGMLERAHHVAHGVGDDTAVLQAG